MDKLQTLIKKCKFNYVNDDITEKHFPKPDKIETKNWKIIRMGKKFTSQEVLDEIKRQGCRPTNCWELVKWASKHKMELKKGEYCLALDKLWTDSGGNHRVPLVVRLIDGGFELPLGLFGGGWGGGPCVLVFCDRSLDPLKLENSSDEQLKDPKFKKLYIKTAKELKDFVRELDKKYNDLVEKRVKQIQHDNEILIDTILAKKREENIKTGKINFLAGQYDVAKKLSKYIQEEVANTNEDVWTGDEVREEVLKFLIKYIRQDIK